MKKRNGCYWFDIDVYPGSVGIALSADGFASEMRWLRVKNPPKFLMPGRPACVHNFTTNDGEDINILCLDIDVASTVEPAEVVGLLAHEAVHVKQNIFRAIGELNPGAEQEAYLVQHLTRTFFKALEHDGRAKQTQSRQGKEASTKAARSGTSTD